MKRTENEIIEILKAIEPTEFEKAPSVIMELELAKGILALIKRQQAEKDALIAGQESLQKHIEKKNAEIRRYKAVIQLLERDVKDAKAEAVRDMADKLGKKISSQLTCSALESKEAYYFCLNEIDEIKEEMVGGKR